MCCFLIVRTAGPHQALVKSGVFHSKTVIVKGGRVFQIPCLQTVRRLKLHVMTINIRSTDVNCTNGVQVSVDGVAQVKVNSSNIEAACENFLGMKEAQMINTISETMECHQRSIISTMTIDDMYKNRKEFMDQVQKCATTDLAGMGILIVSYQLNSITTNNGYLKALGRPQIAEVKKVAKIAEAECTRDAKTQKAKAEKDRDEVKFKTKLEIEKATVNRDLAHQKNLEEINHAKAIAECSVRKQTAILNKHLKDEQMAVKVVERQGEAKVMEEEVKLKEILLESSIKLTSETDKYVMEVKAAADKKVTILKNEANAIEITALGEAEAEIIKAKADAEAKVTALKAKAYEQYGKAVLVHEVIKTLPQIAAEIATPARKMEKITMITSGDKGEIGIRRLVNEVMSVMNDVPDGVNQMTGIDLKGEISKVMTR